jgi:hypothetical protein
VGKFKGYAMVKKKEGGILELNLFVGFQYDSKYHDKEDFVKFVKAINKVLAKSNSPIIFTYTFGVFNVGENVVDEVRIRIANCDIAIFDISENNSNVLFEVGFAFGLKKYVVLLKNEKSKEYNPVPSDVNPYIYIDYVEFQDLLSLDKVQVFTSALPEIIFYKNPDRFFLHKCFFDFDISAKTIIVSGKLPSDKAANDFDDYMYMREKTDLDTVFLLTETLSRVYPEMEIEVKSPEKFSDLDLHKLGDRVNLVVIGGPDYNIVAKEFNHETPYRYIYEGQDIYLENLLTGKIHRPIFNEDNKSATDFGFLVRTNLYSGSSKLLIIGGCRTWGVYGAALLLSSNVNQKNNSMLASLVKKFGKKTSICVPIEANGSLSAMHQPKWDIGDVIIL